MELLLLGFLSSGFLAGLVYSVIAGEGGGCDILSRCQGLRLGGCRFKGVRRCLRDIYQVLLDAYVLDWNVGICVWVVETIPVDKFTMGIMLFPNGE